MKELTVKQILARTLYTDYVESKRIARMAESAAYEEDVIRAMVYRAGVILGISYASKVRRENAELRRENKRMCEAMNENRHDELSRIEQLVNAIFNAEPTPGDEQEENEHE